MMHTSPPVSRETPAPAERQVFWSSVLTVTGRDLDRNGYAPDDAGLWCASATGASRVRACQRFQIPVLEFSMGRDVPAEINAQLRGQVVGPDMEVEYLGSKWRVIEGPAFFADIAGQKLARDIETWENLSLARKDRIDWDR